MLRFSVGQSVLEDRLYPLMMSVDRIQKASTSGDDDSDSESMVEEENTISFYNIFHRHFPEIYLSLLPSFKIVLKHSLESVLPFYKGFPIIQR